MAPQTPSVQWATSQSPGQAASPVGQSSQGPGTEQGGSNIGLSQETTAASALNALQGSSVAAQAPWGPEVEAARAAIKPGRLLDAALDKLRRAEQKVNKQGHGGMACHK